MTLCDEGGNVGRGRVQRQSSSICAAVWFECGALGGVAWCGEVGWGGVGRVGMGWGVVWCDVGVVWGCNSARRDVT